MRQQALAVVCRPGWHPNCCHPRIQMQFADRRSLIRLPLDRQVFYRCSPRAAQLAAAVDSVGTEHDHAREPRLATPSG